MLQVHRPPSERNENFQFWTVCKRKHAGPQIIDFQSPPKRIAYKYRARAIIEIDTAFFSISLPSIVFFLSITLCCSCSRASFCRSFFFVCKSKYFYLITIHQANPIFTFVIWLFFIWFWRRMLDERNAKIVLRKSIDSCCFFSSSQVLQMFRSFKNSSVRIVAVAFVIAVIFRFIFLLSFSLPLFSINWNRIEHINWIEWKLIIGMMEN